MNCPRLVVGDGHLGIWGALRNVYPEADEQRCWNHKLLNVLDRLPKRDQAQAKMNTICGEPSGGRTLEIGVLPVVCRAWT